MLDLHRLRMLREFKHRGTLIGVATAMSSTSAAVSRELTLLEADVGVPLLELAERHVRLTMQAEILVAHTEAVLTRLEQAEAEVAASPGTLIGTMRIAGFHVAAPSLVSTALDLLRAKHPGLLVHLTDQPPDAAMAALSAKEVDLVLVEEYADSPCVTPADVEVKEISRDTVRLALPPGTAVDGDEPWTAIRALAAHPWAMEPSDTPSRRWAASLLLRAGVEPDIRFESRDPTVRVRLVESGHAVALVPDLAWGESTPDVPLVSIGDEGRRRLLTAVRWGESARPAVLACRWAIARAIDQALRAQRVDTTTGMAVAGVRASTPGAGELGQEGQDREGEDDDEARLEHGEFRAGHDRRGDDGEAEGAADLE
ncbi:LysR substrate-binding domain-containing protein [Embleya sp. NPDC001921]